jgi:hypothetical protein
MSTTLTSPRRPLLDGAPTPAQDRGGEPALGVGRPPGSRGRPDQARACGRWRESFLLLRNCTLAFSPDWRYLYVGNFVDGNIDILRVDGDTLTKVANLALPGHPASMRGSTL